MVSPEITRYGLTAGPGHKKCIGGTWAMTAAHDRRLANQLEYGLIKTAAFGVQASTFSCLLNCSFNFLFWHPALPGFQIPSLKHPPGPTRNHLLLSGKQTNTPCSIEAGTLCSIEVGICSVPSQMTCYHTASVSLSLSLYVCFCLSLSVSISHSLSLSVSVSL